MSETSPMSPQDALVAVCNNRDRSKRAVHVEHVATRDEAQRRAEAAAGLTNGAPIPDVRQS